MNNVKIVTGNFIEAIDEINPEVVMSLITPRGICWGLSKILAEQYAEVREMLQVDHAKALGRWQFRKTYNRTMVGAYIQAPHAGNPIPREIFKIISNVCLVMEAENKTKLVLQYPGIPICGLDLNDFVAAVRRAVGERNITVYLACNKPLGDRYRPQRDRMHFDAAAKARAEDLGNWGGGIAALNKWFNEGQPGVLAHQGTSFKSAYSYCN